LPKGEKKDEKAMIMNLKSIFLQKKGSVTICQFYINHCISDVHGAMWAKIC